MFSWDLKTAEMSFYRAYLSNGKQSPWRMTLIFDRRNGLEKNTWALVTLRSLCICSIFSSLWLSFEISVFKCCPEGDDIEQIAWKIVWRFFSFVRRCWLSHWTPIKCVFCWFSWSQRLACACARVCVCVSAPVCWRVYTCAFANVYRQITRTKLELWLLNNSQLPAQSALGLA